MPLLILYLDAKYGSEYFLLKVIAVKQSIVDAEIMSMGLDKHWADKAKVVVNEVRSYPQYLLYHLNEEQQGTVAALGAMYWREYISDLAGGLLNRCTSAEFAERCGWYSQGNKDYEYHHAVLLGIYEELYGKLCHQSTTFFCYRPSMRYSTKRIVFEKISDLEVLEYAIRNAPFTSTRRPSLFEHNPQSNRQLYSIGTPALNDADQWILPDRYQLVWKATEPDPY